MSSPMKCGLCNESPDSEFFITDRTDGTQIMGQTVTAVCVRCFIDKAIEMAQALQMVMEQVSAEEPSSPGVLEQIEADEGTVGAVSSSASPKSKKRPTALEELAAVPAEGAASDD